ncbi:MAG: dihydrodipicolinate synthase family protein [Pseudolabrys sp.]
MIPPIALPGTAPQPSAGLWLKKVRPQTPAIRNRGAWPRADLDAVGPGPRRTIITCKLSPRRPPIVNDAPSTIERCCKPPPVRREDNAMQQPGLIVAPLTPFTDALRIDEPALRREIDYVVHDCRATMVVAAGVETQEYTYLSFEERKELIRRTVELVDGRVPVMVGISHPSFRTSIALAHEAEKLGAAAVQLLAPLRPFAGPPTQGDLIAYFEAVAKETRLPITLYLNPGPGADVSIPDTIALAKLPSIQLIKESSRDLARVSRLIVEVDRAGHARYHTTMQMLLATLQLGGSGATMPPPGSEIARHVIDAFVARDYERAAEIQLQFALFPAKWMHRGLAPAMKAAMDLIGIPVGTPYPPYQPCSREEIEAMRSVLRTTVLSDRLSVTAAA